MNTSPRFDRSPWRIGAFVIASLAACATFLQAVQAQKRDPAGKAGKRVLFDGKSLAGWKNTGFVNSGDVKVEDSAIVMETGGRMTGITTTLKDLPKLDYELTYEAMRVSGNDFFAAATFPVGDSFITFVNGGWGGGVTGLSSINGMDASENETGKSFNFKDKTWYRFRVRVTKNVIRCSIDDKEIVAFDHLDRQVGTRIETRSCQPLGFCTFECTGALRKIEIRMLTPAEIEAADKLDE